MKKFKLSSKQIIIWICVNYGLFIMAFFTLGFMDSNKVLSLPILFGYSAMYNFSCP